MFFQGTPHWNETSWCFTLANRFHSEQQQHQASKRLVDVTCVVHCQNDWNVVDELQCGFDQECSIDDVISRWFNIVLEQRRKCCIPTNLYAYIYKLIYQHSSSKDNHKITMNKCDAHTPYDEYCMLAHTYLFQHIDTNCRGVRVL